MFVHRKSQNITLKQRYDNHYIYSFFRHISVSVGHLSKLLRLHIQQNSFNPTSDNSEIQIIWHLRVVSRLEISFVTRKKLHQ
jgi:hypothetical protein